MTLDGNGNLETEYHFDGTTYITFGFAPEVTEIGLYTLMVLMIILIWKTS